MTRRIKEKDMKIKGEFVIRELMGDTVLIPVGRTALEYNGMITMNPVCGHIWKELSQGKNREEILSSVLEHFEVEEARAKADLDELLEKLRDAGFLEL